MKCYYHNGGPIGNAEERQVNLIEMTQCPNNANLPAYNTREQNGSKNINQWDKLNQPLSTGIPNSYTAETKECDKVLATGFWTNEPKDAKLGTA